ncbi:MAG TPA: bifunctional diaminohydroxyphosphoribosylaminopyrimidine deaminase/5-amino-6-(5-phosphoribosylamino)uracil reductase RibD [bacterium]|nr:bifunctional diaminohydroxyphosphoribosylaminopyrimidine deaminase/5-amino-6-(5-phosphoribosylamino)uracil reductase RibD [bacterium]
MSHRDEEYMREALRLARCGAQTASPNPMVGAVVVSKDRIVGRGYHLRPGCAHAEVLALQEAGSATGGATLYVTLEPCAHWGRTGPCTEAIIGGGVRRVVAAMEDPDRRVRGRGLRRLREAGIETTLGVGEGDARRLNEAYIKHRTTGLPFVTAKWAMTLDGRTATSTGDSRWISGEASRGLVHEIRASADAILVGIGTVLRDDPQLTARGPARHQPARIVVDSALRIPAAARVLTENGAPVIVATTSRAPQAARAALEARGVDVWVADGPDRRVDVRTILEALGRRGMTSLLVEGGSRIHGTFIDAGLVDKVLVFLGSLIVGGAGPCAVGGAGADTIAHALRLVRTAVRQIDQDVVIEGYLPAVLGRGEEVGRCSPGS